MCRVPWFETPRGYHISLAAVSRAGLLLAVLPACTRAQGPETPSQGLRVLEIYSGAPVKADATSGGLQDFRGPVELAFEPFGHMPGHQTTQISVNPTLPVDPRDPLQGSCLQLLFRLADADSWLGTYLLLDQGSAWGTRPGINVQQILRTAPGRKVLLRFKARGEGVVRFKLGGVNRGPYPSSVPLAREPDRSPTRLQAAFREVSIGPFLAKELTNLIDPFCIVCSAPENGGPRLVRVEVDDVRLEVVTDSPTAGAENLAREALRNTLFVAYSPTGYDPTVRPPKSPSEESIRADLGALASLLNKTGQKPNEAGLVLYGCKDGLEKVPAIAKEFQLRVILGIFDPRSTMEVRNAQSLLSDFSLDATIAAVSVGNEAITFGRSSLDDIRWAVSNLRRLTPLPLTTTEVVQAYSDRRLFELDFSLVNAHAIHAGVHEPVAAARWALDQVAVLMSAAPAGHMVVVKELGFPAGPAPFSASDQAAYWTKILTDPRAREVNLCLFEGFSSVPWKRENVTLAGGQTVDVGPHWGVLFDSNLTPRPGAVELLELRKRVGRR